MLLIQSERVDELFCEWDTASSPGCAVAVIHTGEVVYKCCFGTANLELGVPIKPESAFYLASLAKQFTGMAVALLVEAGDLKLKDEMRSYLPELPEIYAGIKIRHLLHHTSGIRDYLSLGRLAGKRMEDVWTEAEFLEMIKRQKSLNFTPGNEALYSNSGYVLLGIIVERVTGMSLAEFSRASIFEPLGMTNTYYKDDYRIVIPGRVSGYSRVKGGGYRNEFTNLETVGDGGLFSSLNDLIRWVKNFSNNKLGGGNHSLMELMQTTGKLNDGTEKTYAFGLTLEHYRGLDVIQHGGSINGARTQLCRFPDHDFSVICLSNLSQFEPQEYIDQIVDIYLADSLEPTVGEEDLTFDKQGIPEQVENQLLGNVNFVDYAGRYFSDELDSVYLFQQHSDSLVLKIRNQIVYDLFWMANDKFSGNENDFQFIRDDTGSVRGFTLGNERIRGLAFEKRYGAYSKSRAFRTRNE